MDLVFPYTHVASVSPAPPLRRRRSFSMEANDIEGKVNSPE
jgi:hypothetical protein